METVRIVMQLLGRGFPASDVASMIGMLESEAGRLQGVGFYLPGHSYRSVAVETMRCVTEIGPGTVKHLCRRRRKSALGPSKDIAVTTSKTCIISLFCHGRRERKKRTEEYAHSENMSLYNAPLTAVCAAAAEGASYA